MSETEPPNDQEMPEGNDFPQGLRGQFHRRSATLDLPLYLDAKLQTGLAAVACARGIARSTLVEELLRKDLEMVEGQ